MLPCCPYRYEDGYTGTEEVIAWFWEVVDGLSDAQRRMLLQFWSGSDGQPADGFGTLDPAFHMVGTMTGRVLARVGARARVGVGGQCHVGGCACARCVGMCAHVCVHARACFC